MYGRAGVVAGGGDMKGRLIGRAAMLLCSAAMTSGAARAEEIRADSPRWATAQQLIGHERAAWSNYAQRDVEASRRLLAADYADVQTDGSVLDAAGHLAFVPQAKLEWHQLDQFHVFALAPDAALVTYRARARDRGASETYEAACTSGWSLRGKSWVNTFYRETPVPAAEPAEGSAAGAVTAP